MKLLINAFSYLLVAGLLMTCKHADPDPNLSVASTPRLKSISFSGIPQENISIDQHTKIISVVMPASIPNYVDIVLELADDADWINKQSRIRGSELFGCDSCFHIYLKDRKDATSPIKTDYRIKRLSSAPLTVDVLSEPMTYYIRNTNTIDLEVPMLNLYGNKLPREARLMHTTTGDIVNVWRDSIVNRYYPGQTRIQYSANTNKLAVYLYDAKLVPGSYQLNLLLDDGTKLSASQPILVKQGTAEVDYEQIKYFGYRVAAGKTLTMTGYNLFEGDVTLDLLDNQNQVHPLLGLGFDKYGRQIRIPVPATLSPGQYAMRIRQHDTKLPYGYCLRVNVSKDEQERLIIGTIGSDVTPCLLHDPASVQRGINVSFTSSIQQQSLDRLSQRALLKLVSLRGNATYFGKVIGYDVNRGWDSNSLMIPASVPSGLYTATLQVLDAQNNVVNESEPYGRILDLK